MSSAASISKELHLELYRKMFTIRKFEEKVSNLFAKNKLPGFVHLYIGQEAVATAVCSVLNDDDYITSTHRGHGHTIAKGGDLNRMMAELYGKATGYCKGKGGSMHITDMKIGMLGANGIVAGGIPIALGAAYGASKIQRNKQVVAAFFGDGATGEGPFWEGIGVAGAWKLPLIFVCENNLYGVGTRIDDVSVGQDIKSRVGGFGIPAVSVDGNNVLEVRAAAAKAVERARDGKGPTFIECKTWRHHGHFEGENTSYIDKDEYDGWMKKDPIAKYREYLSSQDLASSDELKSLEDDVVNRIEKAVDFAESGEYPKPESALEDIYAAQ